jgi:hypothetical protein
LDKPIEMLKIDIEGPEYIILKIVKMYCLMWVYIFIEYHSFMMRNNILMIFKYFKRQGFRYHLKQSFSRKRPFIDTKLVNEKFDM